MSPGTGVMRAAAFVRYGGASGAGHVGWAFDYSIAEVDCGAVENPNGSFSADPADMGYWSHIGSDPMPPMRERGYDDLKYLDLLSGDVVKAYATVKWIATQPYTLFGRNCMDDVYDVLRSYGVPNLPAPSQDWLPNEWFVRFGGQIAPVASYLWQKPAESRLARAIDVLTAKVHKAAAPTWRQPGHPDWHDLQRQLAAVSHDPVPPKRSIQAA
ncbi:MAG: hypothetical protein M1314_03500 [Firmicutes bacterium]|nr:hypothetical protein [Bacillota bacterium]